MPQSHLSLLSDSFTALIPLFIRIPLVLQSQFPSCTQHLMSTVAHLPHVPAPERARQYLPELRTLTPICEHDIECSGAVTAPKMCEV